MLVETVNLHIWGKCNLHCVYCYATFPERPRSLNLLEWIQILDELKKCGVVRITFSGGEPTLHPDLLGMMMHARRIGLQTSIITNGARLTDAMLDELDVVGLTLDAVDDGVLVAMGRTLPQGRSYLQHARELVDRVHAAGVRLKLNTVITALNEEEDLTDAIVELRPYKWKPLQFTTLEDENLTTAARLRVSSAKFAAFVERHRRVEQAGIWTQPESEDVIRRSYVMIDPAGRVIQNAVRGRRLTSRPVRDVGFACALAEAGGYDRDAFLGRGGAVDVVRLPMVLGHEDNH